MALFKNSKTAVAIALGVMGLAASVPAANAGTIAFNFEYVDVTGVDASYLLNQIDPSTFATTTPNILAKGTIFVDGSTGTAAQIQTTGGLESAYSYKIQGLTGTIVTQGKFGGTGSLSLLPTLAGVTNNQLLVSTAGSNFVGGQLVSTTNADAGVDGLGVGYQSTFGSTPAYDLYFDSTFNKGLGAGIDAVTALLTGGGQTTFDTPVFWTVQGPTLPSVGGTPQEVLLAISDGVLVPEPTTISLMGLTLLGIGGLIRRRRA